MISISIIQIKIVKHQMLNNRENLKKILVLKILIFNDLVNDNSNTWSNENSNTRIDKMFYSDGLRDSFSFDYHNTIDNKYSDHKIVIADNSLKQWNNKLYQVKRLDLALTLNLYY